MNDIKNKLPGTALYTNYLYIASTRFNLSLDQCRRRFGLFTIVEWETLFNDVPTMTTEQLAENIKSKMAVKKMTAYRIIQKGVAKEKVYSVLRMGKKAKSQSYTVATLFEVLQAAELELYEVAV